MRVNRNLCLAVVTIGPILGVSLFVLDSCGKSKSANVGISNPNAGPPVAACGGVAIGTIMNGQCPSGQTGWTYQVCQSTGWVPAGSTCQSTASAVNTSVGVQHLGFDDIETVVLNDATALDVGSRQNARYLVLTHKYDYLNENPAAATALAASVPPAPTALSLAGSIGSSSSVSAVLTQYRHGFQKAVNGLSALRAISKATPIDARGTIYRIDLRNYGLSSKDWKSVTAADQFKVVSHTNKGSLIATLLNEPQAWMHADNFTFVSHGNGTVYYNLLKIAANEAQLQTALGVNEVQDFQQFHAVLGGFNGSPIALGKNRQIFRLQSNNGYYWQTADTDLNDKDPATNLIANPLRAVGTAKFKFDAGETIFTLPNGLQAYFLADGKGNRLNAAAQSVVEDNAKPPFITSEIDNAISCSRCHNAGLIHTPNNSVLPSVLANATTFKDPNDVQLIQALYKDQNGINTLIDQDVAQFQQAQAQLGIGASDADPLNYLTDSLRQDIDINQAAAFVFMPVADGPGGIQGLGFQSLLAQSNKTKNELGTLLTPGGTVNFQQFRAAFPDLLQELRIGQDLVQNQ